MTDAETLYRNHNPYREGIDSMGLSFTLGALRHARQALEHGVNFRGPIAKDEMHSILAECAEIKKLLKARGMA